jgi:FRG domain
LATYLLDWTTNPLVALFFASEQAKDELGNPATGEVFVLNNPTPASDEEIKGDNWQQISGLRLYNPRLVDSRFVRQKGLFTIQGLNSKPVPELLASTHELVSHKVPAEVKAALREVLYRMGIDRSTLFPGLDGLCDRINWETKNRVVSNFPPVTGARVIYIQAHGFVSTSAVGIPNVGQTPEQ